MTPISSSRDFSECPGKLSRREFSRKSLMAAAGLTLRGNQEAEIISPLAIAHNDRAAALSSALEAIGPVDFEGKHVYLKANFNSPDDFPATTHPDTLSVVVGHLREGNAHDIVLLERSGMGVTRAIWQKLGITDLAKRLDIKLLPLDELSPEEWREEPLAGGHWKRGVEVPSFLTRESCVVQICNLKTHRFGGHFSASLKNSIGLVAKFAARGAHYNYMEELHASPHQRSMIAEANQIYQPQLIVMDASQVFIEGGPEKGETANPKAIVASRDRIAVDAVGIGLLRIHGAGHPLTKGSVFEQEQLSRAVELNLGVRSPKGIQFLTTDDAGRKLATYLTTIMEKMPDEKK